MPNRVIYRHLTDSRRAWLASLPAKAIRVSANAAGDCQRLGWTIRQASGHYALTPLGRAVLRWGRGDVTEIAAVPITDLRPQI